MKNWLVYLKQRNRERKRHNLLASLTSVEDLAERGEWWQYCKRQWREWGIRRIMARLPAYDPLGHQKNWLKAKVPPDWRKPKIIAGLEKPAQWGIKIIQPAVLLINMCGTWRSLENKPSTHNSGILGGHGDYGKENPELGFDYSPLSWQQLCTVAVQHFERHPGMSKARDRLHNAGIATHWDCTTYNATTELNLYYELNHDTVAAIVRLAKEDAVIETPDQSTEFDRVFDLYLKQHWGPDWKKWKEIGPVVDWPPPKFMSKACARLWP